MSGDSGIDRDPRYLPQHYVAQASGGKYAEGWKENKVRQKMNWREAEWGLWVFYIILAIAAVLAAIEVFRPGG